MDDSEATDSAESRGRPDAIMGQPTHPGTDGPPLTELLRTALSEEAWDATQETLGLLKLLALGQREVEAGEASPSAQAVERFRARDR